MGVETLQRNVRRVKKERGTWILKGKRGLSTMQRERKKKRKKRKEIRERIRGKENREKWNKWALIIGFNDFRTQLLMSIYWNRPKIIIEQ